MSSFFEVEPSRDWRLSLVTSRNNLHAPGEGGPFGGSLDPAPRRDRPSAFRRSRPYVAACGMATLALYLSGGRVVFTPLMCGSWSCPHCRKRKAARLLDGLRRGMESRAVAQRYLVTLTLNPADFGAVATGWAYWDKAGRPCLPGKAARKSVLWSEPTLSQFDHAIKAMSREFARLMRRLNMRAARVGAGRWGYFRVVELHRNGWPHYHVILEHRELLEPSITWGLGLSDVRAVDLDAAVGEVAPYLVCAEKKGDGHKAYQFAGVSLPKHFRLWSSSKGFLGVQDDVTGQLAGELDVVPAEGLIEHALMVRGHFTSHIETLRNWGASAAYVLPEVPPDGRLSSGVVGVQSEGDGAILYYTQLVDHAIAHEKPRGRTIRQVFDESYEPL